AVRNLQTFEPSNLRTFEPSNLRTATNRHSPQQEEEMSDRNDAPGMPLRELAEALGGTLEGDGEVLIVWAAGLEDAAPGTVVRVESAEYLASAAASAASALLLPPDLPSVEKPAIRVPDVRRAFI